MSPEISRLIEEHHTGMLYRDELEEIASAIVNSPWRPGDYICEIGCYVGMTTTFMGRVCDLTSCPAKILTIDCFEDALPEHNNVAGNEQAYRQNLKRYAQESRCKLLRGRSDEVAEFVSSSIRLLIVDGGHRYEDCRGDLLRYVPKIVDGGIVVVDDYWEPYPGVCKATDEVMKGPSVSLKKHGSKWKSFTIHHISPASA